MSQLSGTLVGPDPPVAAGARPFEILLCRSRGKAHQCGKCEEAHRLCDREAPSELWKAFLVDENGLSNQQAVWISEAPLKDVSSCFQCALGAWLRVVIPACRRPTVTTLFALLLSCRIYL